MSQTERAPGQGISQYAKGATSLSSPTPIPSLAAMLTCVPDRQQPLELMFAAAALCLWQGPRQTVISPRMITDPVHRHCIGDLNHILQACIPSPPLALRRRFYSHIDRARAHMKTRRLSKLSIGMALCLESSPRDILFKTFADSVVSLLRLMAPVPSKSWVYPEERRTFLPSPRTVMSTTHSPITQAFRPRQSFYPLLSTQLEAPMPQVKPKAGSHSCITYQSTTNPKPWS